MNETAHVENLVLGGGEPGDRDAIHTHRTMAEGLNLLLTNGFT